MLSTCLLLQAAKRPGGPRSGLEGAMPVQRADMGHGPIPQQPPHRSDSVGKLCPEKLQT